MINAKDFTIRLQKIIEFYGESASSFAEKIGVQRSSISHVLSGRNKPSLEFILKILSSYPEVELYWLLNGKGSFPSENKTTKVAQNEPSSNSTIKKVINQAVDNKSIERIVIFYSDGTFRNFQN